MRDLNWYKANIDLERFIMSSGCGFVRDRSSTKKSVKLYIPGTKSKKDTVLLIATDNKTGNQIYWNVTDFGFDKTFTIIDFVHFFILHNTTSTFDFKKIVGVIKDRSAYIETEINHFPVPEQKAKSSIKDLRLHKFNTPGYLASRSLPLELIEKEMFSADLMSAEFVADNGKKYTNTCFLFRDIERKTVSALVRYYLNGKSISQFYGDKSNSLWYSLTNIPTARLVLTESPEDALSYYQLHLPQTQDTMFAATGGEISNNQFVLILRMIEMYKMSEIILAFDNDQQGFIYRLKTFIFMFNSLHPEQRVSYVRNKSDVILNIPNAILEIHPIEENCIVKRKASADQMQIFLDLNSTEIIKQLEVLFGLFILPHFNVINVYSISKDFNQDLINEHQNL